MTTYVGLLRGINVGGARRLPMAACRAAFEAGGASDVRTYIQSGNVVFDHAADEDAALAALVPSLARAAGFDVPLVLRTAEAWATLADRCPFDDPDPTKVHVAFRPVAPEPDPLDEVDWAPFAPEAIAVDGREVFLHLPDGMGRSKLAQRVARVAPDATVRNRRTVDQLAALARDRGR